MEKKPICDLSGVDGNIFSLVGKAMAVLVFHKLHAESKEMSVRIMSEATSYEDALRILGEYVEIIIVEEAEEDDPCIGCDNEGCDTCDDMARNWKAKI